MEADGARRRTAMRRQAAENLSQETYRPIMHRWLAPLPCKKVRGSPRNSTRRRGINGTGGLRAGLRSRHAAFGAAGGGRTDRHPQGGAAETARQCGGDPPRLRSSDRRHAAPRSGAWPPERLHPDLRHHPPGAEPAVPAPDDRDDDRRAAFRSTRSRSWWPPACTARTWATNWPKSWAIRG